MNICKSCLIIFTTAFLFIHNARCTEIVPVYMWGTVKFTEHVPALHKISEDSFKDTILDHLKKSYIVVFAENTLSPEDFAQRDQSGGSVFPNLHKLKNSATVNYKPHVQNPIRAVKQLYKKVTEISIASLIKNDFNVPKDDILIIDLNDAKDEEHRFDMLKRHDSDVISIYKELLKKHDDILAIYTAHHTSWIMPEEVKSYKKSRSLLAEDTETSDNRKKFQTSNTLLYIKDIGNYSYGSNNIAINNFTSTSTIVNDSSITLKLSGETIYIDFLIKYDDSGYWTLTNVTIVNGSVINDLPFTQQIYAPFSFSYHCNDMIFGNITQNLTLPGFQIYVNTTNSTLTFGDTYDCVGFTSIPIWSGLFVTLILLLIMTFGLTMMMDIRTMDRFDDAKGKTITINAAD